MISRETLKLIGGRKASGEVVREKRLISIDGAEAAVALSAFHVPFCFSDLVLIGPEVVP